MNNVRINSWVKCRPKRIDMTKIKGKKTGNYLLGILGVLDNFGWHPCICAGSRHSCCVVDLTCQTQISNFEIFISQIIVFNLFTYQYWNKIQWLNFIKLNVVQARNCNIISYRRSVFEVEKNSENRKTQQICPIIRMYFENDFLKCESFSWL